MWRYLCLATAAWALAPPKINLGDYLVQRAVQQQLNYMADLKNEPLGNWLKAFQDHAHLDSNSPRRFPGTYSAAFGQLIVQTRIIYYMIVSIFFCYIYFFI